MSKTVLVTRDVPQSDPHNWAGRDVAAGEKLYVYRGDDYGAVDSSLGIALSETGPNDTPFFEFPLNAIRFTWEE